jgi:hypothetical protein
VRGTGTTLAPYGSEYIVGNESYANFERVFEVGVDGEMNDDVGARTTPEPTFARTPIIMQLDCIKLSRAPTN